MLENEHLYTGFWLRGSLQNTEEEEEEKEKEAVLFQDNRLSRAEDQTKDYVFSSRKSSVQLTQCSAG